MFERELQSCTQMERAERDTSRLRFLQEVLCYQQAH